MAENKAKALINSIKQYEPLFEPNALKSFFHLMADFYDYSFNNKLLIAMQNPNVSFVAGYQTWQKKYNRTVKHGEHGIKILAPSPYKTKIEREIINPVTKTVMLDKNGQPMTELVNIEKSGFKAITVFDISQTEGEPFTIEKNHYSDTLLLQAFNSYLNITDLDDLQKVQSLFVQNMNSLIDMKNMQGLDNNLIAECASYILCQHYNISPSSNFFNQLAQWSIGKDKEVKKDFLKSVDKYTCLEIQKINKILLELDQQPELPSVDSEEVQQPSNVLHLNDFRNQDEAVNKNSTQTYVYEVDNGIYGVVETTATGYDCTTYTKAFDKLHQESVTDNPLSPEQALESIFDDKHEINLASAEEFNKSFEITQKTGWPPILHPYLLDGKLPEMDITKEPVVTVIWSEDSELKDNLKMPLSVADKVFADLDENMKNQMGYNKTKFEISYTICGESCTYEGRQDFGDGDGSLLNHIQIIQEDLLQDDYMKNYILKNEGQEQLNLYMEKIDSKLNELLPYFKLHCTLSEIEQLATIRRDEVSTMDIPEEAKMSEMEYYSALLYYVSECRHELNTALGNYHFPEIPQKEEFISPSILEYKENVNKEIAEEARNAAMSLEEYAANNYEPKPVVKIISACISNYKNMVALVGEDDKVYLGKRENYDNMGHYDNRDSSLLFISENIKMYYYLYGEGFLGSQELMLYHGQTLEDYQEYADLKAGILSRIEQIKEFLFDGKPFVPPEQLDKKLIQEFEGTEAAMNPFYFLQEKEPVNKKNLSVLKQLEANKKKTKLQESSNQKTTAQKNNPQRD